MTKRMMISIYLDVLKYECIIVYDGDRIVTTISSLWDKYDYDILTSNV